MNTNIKMGICIAPNGLMQPTTGNDGFKLQFSLALLFDNQTTNPAKITKTFLKEAQQLLHTGQQDGKFRLEIGGKQFPFEVNGNWFLKETNNWDQLFSEDIFLANLKKDKPLVIANENEWSLIDNKGVTSVDVLDDDKSRKNKLHELIEQYDKAGLEQNQTQKTELEQYINFNSIQATLLEHPTMARHYGLLVDIAVNFNLNDWKKEYFDKGVELAFLVTKDFYTHFRPDVDDSVSGVSVNSWKEREGFVVLSDKNNSEYCIFFEKGPHPKKKRYHGRPNFGLLNKTTNVTPINGGGQAQLIDLIEWKKNTKITEYNAQLASINQNKENENLFETDSKSAQSQATQGIIAYLNNIKPQDFNSIFKKEGVVGHSISTVRGGKQAGVVIRSLTARKCDYTLPNDDHKESIEYGFLKFDALIETADGSLKMTNEWWKWEGQNLCIPKLGEVDDHKEVYDPEKGDEQKIPPELDETGTNSEVTAEHIHEKGFHFMYDYLPESNVMLVDGYQYSFFIHEVESISNYHFPVSKTENNYELTLEHIQKEDYFSDLNFVLANFIFDYNSESGAIFSIDKISSPIDSPTIVGPEKYEKEENPNVESDDFVLLKAEDDINEKSRLIFPPQITNQFAQLLGHYEKENLVDPGDDVRVYVQRAMELVERNEKQLPTTSAVTQVEYLSDTRGTHLLMIPANWQTKHYLKNIVSREWYYEFHAFEYSRDNDTKYIYRDVTPFELIFKKGAGFSVTKMENGVVITVPKYIELSFRFHLTDQDSYDQIFPNDDKNTSDKKERILNLRTQSPFETVSVKHITKQMDELMDRGILNLYSGRLFGEQYKKYSATEIDIESPNGASAFWPKLYLRTEQYKIIDDGESNLIQNKKLAQLCDEDVIFLDTEYSSEVVTTRMGNLEERKEALVEESLYPSLFEFKCSFDRRGLDILSDSDTDEDLIVFNINENASLIIKKQEGEIKAFIENGSSDFILDIGAQSINGLQNYSLRVGFEYWASFEGAELDISIGDSQNFEDQLPMDSYQLIRTEEKGDRLINRLGLPYQKLSSDRIKVSPNLEEYVLYSPVSFVATLASLSHWYDENKTSSNKLSYLQLQNESDLIFKKKCISVGLESPFTQFYPKSPQSDLMTQTKIKKELFLENDVVLDAPQVNVVPHFYELNEHPSEKEMSSIRKTHLVFEIERPWDGGYLGIVIDDSTDEERERVSGIGRDITKSVVRRSDNFYRIQEHLLGFGSNTLALDRGEEYLQKYLFTTDAKDPEIVSIKRTGGDRGSYELIVLRTFFNTKKNVWMAAICMDGFKELEDPFVRLSFVKISYGAENFHPFKTDFLSKQLKKYSKNKEISYKPNSSTVVSPSSDPVYLPLLTTRSIRVLERSNMYIVNAKKNNLNIKDDNTYFVAALYRQKITDSFNVIEGDGSIPVLVKTFTTHNKLVIQKDELLSLELSKAFLVIYEVEATNNLGRQEVILTQINSDLSAIETDPRLRIVYAKEFHLN